MEFWQTPVSTPKSAQVASFALGMPSRVPEEQFTQHLQQVYDQPGHAQALHALTSAGQRSRIDRGKKKRRQ